MVLGTHKNGRLRSSGNSREYARIAWTMARPVLRRPIIVNANPLRRLASLAIASLALTACASSSTTGSTSLTAADVSAMPDSREPVGSEAAAQPPKAEIPSDVLCRAKDAFGVVNELSITWTSAGGAGFLRRITPSGMEETLRVRAERYRDLVIADAPNEEDLMNHLAVVGRHKGKLHMRVGGTSPAWVPCD